jgi:hypothetical protein
VQTLIPVWGSANEYIITVSGNVNFDLYQRNLAYVLAIVKACCLWCKQ